MKRIIKSICFTLVAMAALVLAIACANPQDAPKATETVAESTTVPQKPTVRVTKETQEPVTEETTTEADTIRNNEQYQMTPEEFEQAGVIFYNGWKFTYYSENVLPGGGLDIPGRWSDGSFVRDQDGYLCVASNEHEFGTIIDTPFGEAKVYDMIGDGVTGVIDIYVSF